MAKEIETGKSAAEPNEIVCWNNLPDVTDRKFWEKQRSNPLYPEIRKNAQEACAQELISPMPHYYDVFVTGNRIRYQEKLFSVQDFGSLAVAYCIDQEPRFLKNIEDRLRILLDLPTWILPAHDREKLNVSGKTVDIDLNSSKLADELSTLLYLLGPVLNHDLAEKLKAELFRRLVIPVEDAIAGKSPLPFWMKVTSNWNAVCTSGVVGAVLRLPMPAKRRDDILNRMLENNKIFLDGFGSDFYCSEGISYFFFGFGHYMRMAMLLKQFDGRDLFEADPRSFRIAMFPENFMISPVCFPTYADIPIDFKLNPFLMELRDILTGRRKGFSCKVPPNGNLVSIAQFDNGLDALALQLSLFSGEPPFSPESCKTVPMTVFPSAESYIVRRTADTHLSVAFKGGSNNEMHNHNDVGSYIVAVDDTAVVTDPGKETYQARTFSERRYESNLLNSFGHSVPRIGGKLQSEMKYTGDTRARLLEETFADGAPLFVKFDIRRPYQHVEGIEKLERSFSFTNRDDECFTVTDEAVFRDPLEFEGAVITFGEVRQLSEKTFLITEKGKSLLLDVDASLPFDFHIEVIKEQTDHKRPVNRMTFAVKEKVCQVKMTFKYSIPQDNVTH